MRYTTISTIPKTTARAIKPHLDRVGMSVGGFILKQVQVAVATQFHTRQLTAGILILRIRLLLLLHPIKAIYRLSVRSCIVALPAVTVTPARGNLVRLGTVYTVIVYEPGGTSSIV